MGKWNYTLKLGREIRQVINDDSNLENNCKLIGLLRQAYHEILKHKDLFVDEDEDLDAVEDAIYSLDGDEELLEAYQNDDPKWEEYVYDDEEDLINARLYDFYDICDSLRIWVEL